MKGRQQLEKCDTLKSTQSKSLHTENSVAGSDIHSMMLQFISKHKTPALLCYTLSNYCRAVSDSSPTDVVVLSLTALQAAELKAVL